MRGVREAAREPSGDEKPDDPVVDLPVDRPVPVLFLTRRRRFLRASAISGKMVFRSVWKWGKDREREREREGKKRERERGRKRERETPTRPHTHMYRHECIELRDSRILTAQHPTPLSLKLRHPLINRHIQHGKEVRSQHRIQRARGGTRRLQIRMKCLGNRVRHDLPQPLRVVSTHVGKHESHQRANLRIKVPQHALCARDVSRFIKSGKCSRLGD